MADLYGYKLRGYHSREFDIITNKNWYPKQINLKSPHNADILSEASRYALRIGKISVLKLRASRYASRNSPFGERRMIEEMIMDNKYAVF